MKINDLTPHQSLTIRAALVYWKREGLRSEGHERDIATANGRLSDLPEPELDALIEQFDVSLKLS